MPITVPTTATAISSTAFGIPVANALNNGMPTFSQSGAAQTATATEAKDTGVGDIVLTVTSATVWYRIKYKARLNAVGGAINGDLRIRDGGAASPTTTSTLLTGASSELPAAGVPQDTVAEQLVQFSVGTHTLGGFYAKVTGAGTSVNADNATGQLRLLEAEQVTF